MKGHNACPALLCATVCVFVCICTGVLWMYVCMRQCEYVHVYFMCVCCVPSMYMYVLWVYVYVCICAHVYVVYVCMCVCTCISECVCRCICAYICCCGSLNVIGPHNLIGLGGVVLLEEVCHCGHRLWGLILLKSSPVRHITSWCLEDVGLSTASPAPCLSAHCHVPMMIMDWTSEM